jgi:hypothetical protein
MSEHSLQAGLRNIVGYKEVVRDAIFYGHIFRSEVTYAINVALSRNYYSNYNN